MSKRGMFTTGDRCEECYGSGDVLETNGITRKTCPACFGLAVELTDIGQELIALLTKSFCLKPKDAKW